MNLDRVDVEILRALQGDARLSYRDLARRTGVSVPTVSARVANLEQMGVLAGYHAAVNPERLGQLRLVLVVRCRASMAGAVGSALAGLPQVRWTVGTEGSRIVAEAVLAGPGAVDAFLKSVRSIDGVASFDRHIATRALKDDPRAVIEAGVAAQIDCFECGKRIEGAPVKVKMDGRTHYLCCSSCEALYRDRYGKIRAAAGRVPRHR